MAKYIIYVPSDLYEVGGTFRTPIKVGNGDMSWYDTDLRVEPYTEPDRKAIEDEVWENTWKMFLTEEDFGATMGDSYSEAKAKYDAWKQEKEDETIKQKVVDLAEEIGIHRLYAIVREIRGE